MPSRQPGLRRSPYQDKPSGMEAWLGEAPSSDVQDVPDVRGKVGRIAGPKWSPEMLQQARDAVLFLRQRAGRPTMTLTDALDEAIGCWLDEMRAQHNGGERFPPQGRLR